MIYSLKCSLHSLIILDQIRKPSLSYLSKGTSNLYLLETTNLYFATTASKINFETSFFIDYNCWAKPALPIYFSIISFVFSNSPESKRGKLFANFASSSIWETLEVAGIATIPT